MSPSCAGTTRRTANRVAAHSARPEREANGLYTKVNAVLDAAEGQAGEHGYHKDKLQAVLMIGGSSIIPSIRRLVRGRYAQRDDEADVTQREIGSATFILCQPPAKLGDPRFLATFAIDDQRHLCVSVQDTQTGKTLCRKEPMVKLT